MAVLGSSVLVAERLALGASTASEGLQPHRNALKPRLCVQGKPQRVTWFGSDTVLARVQGRHLGAAGVPDLVHNALVHVALPRVEVQGDHLQVQGLVNHTAHALLDSSCPLSAAANW